MGVPGTVERRGKGNLSGILGWFAPMRWLMIGLLVSLGALLFAAGGVARHVWLQRREHERERLAALNARPGNRPGSVALKLTRRTENRPRKTRRKGTILSKELTVPLSRRPRCPQPGRQRWLRSGWHCAGRQRFCCGLRARGFAAELYAGSADAADICGGGAGSAAYAAAGGGDAGGLPGRGSAGPAGVFADAGDGGRAGAPAGAHGRLSAGVSGGGHEVSFLWRRARLSRWLGGYGGAAVSAAAGSVLILGCGGLWLAAMTHGYGPIDFDFRRGSVFAGRGA